MNKRKMKLMTNIAIAAIKNMTKYGQRDAHLTDKDLDLMAAIVVNILKTQNDEKERFEHVFFKGRDPATGKYKFVSDTRLLQMELVVKKLVEGKVEEIDVEQDMNNLVIHQEGDAKRLEYFQKCLELIKRTIGHIVVVGGNKTRREPRKVRIAKELTDDEEVVDLDPGFTDVARERSEVKDEETQGEQDLIDKKNKSTNRV